MLALLTLVAIDPSLLRVTDINGVTVDAAPSDAIVVVFLTPGCPVANYFHPTLRRLNDDWSKRNVTLVAVHATHTVTAEQARTHREEYDVAGTVVVDSQQTLAHALSAKVTPEAFVLTPDGRVHYRGRIDDTYIGFGQRRQVVSDPTLKNAVDAVLSGQSVKPSKTDAVGCRIRFAKS